MLDVIEKTTRLLNTTAEIASPAHIVKPQPCRGLLGLLNRQHGDWLTADIHGTGNMPAFVRLPHVFPMGRDIRFLGWYWVSATAEAHVCTGPCLHIDTLCVHTKYGTRCRQVVIGVWWQWVTLSEHKCVCLYARGSGYCVAAECLTREDVSLVWEAGVTAMRFRGKWNLSRKDYVHSSSHFTSCEFVLQWHCCKVFIQRYRLHR